MRGELEAQKFCFFAEVVEVEVVEVVGQDAQLFPPRSSPILRNSRPSHRAASTQRVVRNSLWASDGEMRDSNFWVFRSNRVDDDENLDDHSVAAVSSFP